MYMSEDHTLIRQSNIIGGTGFDLSQWDTLPANTFDHLGWHGIVAPTGTPKETVAYLNRELVKVLSSREVRERIMGLGYDPTTTTVDEFADIIKRDQARYLKVIKESGIRAE